MSSDINQHKVLDASKLEAIPMLTQLIFISYCINTTRYWLRARFKKNDLASSPLILHKANILWH